MKCKKGIDCKIFKKAKFCNNCMGGNIVSSDGCISTAGRKLIIKNSHLKVPLNDKEIEHLIDDHSL